MAFIDGENLSNRYEGMLGEGSTPHTLGSHPIFRPVTHERGLFVWSPYTLCRLKPEDHLVRAHYYTTFTGAHDQLDDLSQRIGGCSAYGIREFLGTYDDVRLIPKVFKKSSRGAKTKSVDINLTVDVLQYVHQNALDGVFLVTGDGDYAPLVQAVMAAGKRVYVSALSSGLAKTMAMLPDQFADLDPVYFEVSEATRLRSAA